MASVQDISKDLSPDFWTGVTSVGTSIVALSSINFPYHKGVQLKAAAGNTGTIYVGKAAVSASTGFPLAAGEGVFIPVEEITKIFVVSDAAAQSVIWMAA